jgi:transposase InsO family protein
MAVGRSQYISTEFAVHLGALKLRGSMGRVGQRWDNAMAESFFSSLKNELVYRTVFPTRAESPVGYCRIH